MNSVHSNNSSFYNPFISNQNFLSMSKAPEFTPKVQQADFNMGEEDFSSFAQVLEEATASEEERIRQHLASRKF